MGSATGKHPRLFDHVTLVYFCNSPLREKGSTRAFLVPFLLLLSLCGFSGYRGSALVSHPSLPLASLPSIQTTPIPSIPRLYLLDVLLLCTTCALSLTLFFPTAMVFDAWSPRGGGGGVKSREGLQRL